jgi:hypothetical protein
VESQKVPALISWLRKRIVQVQQETTPEEFQTVLQWLADFVEVNRSEEPA